MRTICLSLAAISGAAVPALAQTPPMAGFAAKSLAGHSPVVAADMQSIIAPFWRGLPEGIEGRQRVSIAIGRVSGNTYRADVVLSGLLDDAVRARHIRAHITQDQSQWRLTALGERWRCARSGSSARWTTKPCS